MRLPSIRRPARRRGGLAAALIVAVVITGVIQSSGAVPASAVTTANDLTLSVDDGQQVSGTVALIASDKQSADAAAISIDGVDQTVTRSTSPTTIAFEAHGYLATTKNTIIFNGNAATAIVPATDYNSYATGRFTVPQGALHTGVNTATFWAGSTTMMNDPKAGSNDDFNVRNLRLEFADGTTATDPAMSKTAIANLGDDGGNHISWTWTITVPAGAIVTTSTASWNADAAEAGEHHIVATSADGLRSVQATVTSGTLAPEPERVVLTPPTDPSTSQSFTWRTGSATTDGAVHLRKAGSSDAWIVTNAYANPVISDANVATRTHSATMTGLQPGTRYEYYVGNSAAVSETYEFTTAGVAGDPFTFLYFGDAQNELTEKWAPVVEEAYDRFPNAVGSVNAGDLVNEGGDDAEWTEWFDAMDGHSQTTNVIAAPGNHEYVGDSFLQHWKSAFEYDHNGPQWDGQTGATEAEVQEAAYRKQIAKALEETAYYTDYQGVRFITLNAGRDEAKDLMTPSDLPPCSVGCPNPTQLWLDMQREWIDHLLANNPNKWAVAVFHQPVLSTAVGRDETDIRKTWMPVFENKNIDLVLMGHDHTYARGFLNKDATSAHGVTTGPVYAVSVSGPKYYEQQPANDNVWTQNGATQVVSAGHTSTFQGITVTGDQIHYQSIVAAKWDDKSTTTVPVGGVLDDFTITKYDSGAKFVTEKGVAVPADPGAPAQPDDSGIAFTIPNGSIVSGVSTIDAADEQSTTAPIRLAVDGVDHAVVPRTARTTIAFEAHGYLATTKNTIIFNGDPSTAVVPGAAYNNYATGRFTVPDGALHPGVNTVTFWAGSTTAMNDPTPGANDDFNVRNLRLEFSDGATASDPTMSTTAIANLGDSTGNHVSWTWTITVPEKYFTSGSSMLWDTTALESGSTHQLTATSADGTRHTSISVTVDNHEAVSLDAADGDLVHGVRQLTATTDAAPTISVDGTSVPVELRRRVVEPEFVFEGDGFQPDAAMDSIWVNGQLYRVLGVPEAAHGYKEVRVPIPWEKLSPGKNTIRIRAGGNLDPQGNDADSFTTRAERVEFAGGRSVSDPASPAATVLSYGPSVKYHDFTVYIPDRYETVYQADWDTSTVTDGEHRVVVRHADGTSEASSTVVVDNSGPQLSVGAPLADHDYGTDGLVVDASATDAHDVASLALTIDDEPVTAGQRIDADELRDGDHTFVARARDALGNESQVARTFRTVGNLPRTPSGPAPSAGAVAQSPNGVQLGATVSDPTSDPMDVDFRWAYRGDFAQGGVGATAGSSTTAAPQLGTGAALATDDREAISVPDGRSVTTRGDAAYPYQQFDIAVPGDTGAETYDVQWDGSVPAAERAALSVWNYAEEAWELVAEGEGADLHLTGTAHVADTVRDGIAHVLVQDLPATVIAEGDENAVWAWISDTQFYSESDPATYRKEVQWTLDHRESDGIGYALHTGDIVNQKDEMQWQAASAEQKLWDDAKMPYGIVPGNHDIDGDGTYTMYKKYFGESRYRDNAWYGAGYDDNVEHYDIVSTPAADYMIVYVDWYLDQGDIDWANKVIAAHPDDNVIVATHQWFDAKGGYITPAPQIWDQIVAPNPNVDVVLSGHVGVWTNVKRVDANRSVIEVMADYQSAPQSGSTAVNGDGWMRTITFDTKDQTFSNATFSVNHSGNHWQDEATENFTLPIKLEAPARSVATDYVGVIARTTQTIASRAGIASGSTVTVPSGELVKSTRYSWYVQATDDEGFSTASPVWAFTTAAVLPDTTAPVLTVPSSTSLFVGDSFGAMDGVSSVDDRDGDLSGRVLVSGAVDTSHAGRYEIGYSVADAAGNRATATRVVTVSLRDFGSVPRPSVSGDARVGRTVNAEVPAWVPAASMALQWVRDGQPIAGATGPTLALDSSWVGARISVQVTGTRDGYAWQTVASDDVTVAKGVLTSAKPSITGKAVVGATLSVKPGSWTPAPSYSYRWYADGKAIAGATKSKFLLTAKQRGARITVSVTGSRAGYETASVSSGRTPVVAAGVMKTRAPRISGSARVGATLRASTATWSPSARITYRWYANGHPIAGATHTTLRLGRSQAGARITVRATGSASGYSTAVATSGATRAVRR